MARSKTPSRSKPSSARTAAPARTPAASPDEVRGELRQLAEIRARFPALPADTAAALFGHHDEASCREKGTATRAADTLRIAMTWARTFGEHASDPALSPVRVRWFLDCLTALGTALTGTAPAPNPAQESAYDDVAQTADKLLRRTERRARQAAGSNAGWRAALDKALTPDAARDARVSRLEQLATLLVGWLASKPGTPAPPLAAFDVTERTVDDLRRAARALDDAIARLPAPQQIDRDSPAVNATEGRLYFAMRPLWDDLAEAREDGRTSLQLAVSPALLRGLDLNVRKRAKGAPDAPRPAPA